MNPRRTHSSIDNLPAALQKAMEQMLVDNLWPDDFSPERSRRGKPKYKDLEIYCGQKGFEVSKSAIGRFGIRMRVLAQMKNSGVIVRQVMEGLDAETTSQTQKALAEMLTARMIELASEKKLSPVQLKMMSQAARDCGSLSIKADQYRQQQQLKNAQTAAKNTKAKLTKAGVDRKLIQEIIDEHLGVIKS